MQATFTIVAARPAILPETIQRIDHESAGWGLKVPFHWVLQTGVVRTTTRLWQHGVGFYCASAPQSFGQNRRRNGRWGVVTAEKKDLSMEVTIPGSLCSFALLATAGR